MANITITERMRGVFWFLALWIAGVGGTMLLALPFKLLIKWGASAGF
ncbi:MULTISPECIES: hypothetical protein [unclassified Caballeronia]|nr:MULTISPECIES: hypothetical protein [unclassified Caballeronia]MDR5739390.1 hypothetical protein [Caballeronia sp. LZ016]MDR5807878.1 hypothetical protein [Caballeronia sp. LZ019]